MADEGLHEIQLNGKQLVFLFMASTVVAVVIFLCGVMVGRGVRAQRPAEAVEASVDAATDPTASTPAPREPAPSSASIPSNAPVAANETLTYPSRLEGQEPVEETLKPGLGARDSGLGTRDSGLVAKAASPKPEPATTNDRRGGPSLSAEARSAKAEGPPELAAAGEPAGNGFVVQVAAVNSRSEADAIATRLAGKGYPTFVTTPPGGVKMFRVRIGKYPTRREAETTAARLEKEDQFKPWITR